MSSGLFHIVRPHWHLPLTGEMMKMMKTPLSMDLAVAAEVVLAVKMMKIHPMLISTEMNFLQVTQRSNDHINGEERVELSGSATAAVRLRT